MRGPLTIAGSAIVVLSCAFFAIPVAHAARSAPGSASPPVNVMGADLVTASTGQVLWSKNAGLPRPMGSITKVMTALLVLRAGHLDRTITVTRSAIRYVSRDGASSAGLIPGDVLTARQNLMARSLGMTSTHFSSFDGMPFPTEHSTYSSPADLVKLGEAAMRHRIFRQIVAQRRFVLPAGPHHHRYLWRTTDRLLLTYPGAIGIKTGDTDAAGNCLLFEAKRDGRTLIGVVLHAAPTRDPGSAIAAARHILTWGFSHL